MRREAAKLCKDKNFNARLMNFYALALYLELTNEQDENL